MGYEVPTRVHVYIFYPKKEILKEGVIKASEQEQTVIEATGLMNLEGYIDLSPMTNGDTVILRRYVKINRESDYKLHGEETYIGAQNQPLIRFPPLAGYYGIKITIQQTSGTFKTFQYQFFKEI